MKKYSKSKDIRTVHMHNTKMREHVRYGKHYDKDDMHTIKKIK
jgi:hypothetical protein